MNTLLSKASEGVLACLTVLGNGKQPVQLLNTL